MTLQTLADLEHSIGGRPKHSATMVRMTFYLPDKEAAKLKQLASDRGQNISELVRQRVWPLLTGEEKPISTN